MQQFDKSLVWFRRNLRRFDHAVLHHAAKQSRCVFCIFIFSKKILNTQLGKFDPEGKFIRRYLPQLGKVPAKFIHALSLITAAEMQHAGVRLGNDYPFPIRNMVKYTNASWTSKRTRIHAGPFTMNDNVYRNFTKPDFVS